jgi:5-formyltetrahydrofolate cyclo-ligase
MNKDELRKRAKHIRDNIPDEIRKQSAQNLKNRVQAVVSDEQIIGTYMSIRNEIEPPHMIKNAQMALPVIRNKTTLEFYSWSVGQPLVKRDFDIPIPDTRDLSPIIPDIIFAPLLMCDVHGNRLGYGAGHYDRYLASLATKPKLIGVCFDEQIYDGELPNEPHDVKLDLIITPSRTITCL